jgi:hypothetical protein
VLPAPALGCWQIAAAHRLTAAGLLLLLLLLVGVCCRHRLLVDSL